MLFILPPLESPCRLFPVALVEQLGDYSWCVQLAAIQHWLYALPAHIYKKVLLILYSVPFLKFIVLSSGIDLWDKMVNNTSMS